MDDFSAGKAQVLEKSLTFVVIGICSGTVRWGKAGKAILVERKSSQL